MEWIFLTIIVIADNEHDVQPSDLEELAAVAFLSWSSCKLDLLELYSIHGMK